MWAFKLAGSVLLLLSGACIGGLAVDFEREKLTVLDSWIDLLRFIQEQIDCYLMPVKDILPVADKELLHACRFYKNDRSLEEGLRRSALYLPSEALRLLRTFVKEIGGSCREEQLKRCEYYRQALLTIRQKQAEGLTDKCKLYRGMSLCISIGVALLLW